MDEVHTSVKGKIFFEEFLQLFHDDCSQSSAGWIEEMLPTEFDDEYWTSTMAD
jgi:hypothetical protein